MRIAYVCPDLGIPVLGSKGASVHVREFTDTLVELGHVVRIVAAASGSEKSRAAGPAGDLLPQVRAELSILAPTSHTEQSARELADSLLRLGLPRTPSHLRSELRHLLADSEFSTRAQAELQDFQPELVIARHALFSVAGAEIAQAFGCPLVLEVNAPLSEERRRYWELTLDAPAECAERAAFSTPDLIVAVSEGVRAHVTRSGASSDRVIVLPNGVDLAQFQPTIDPSPVRSRYQLTDKLIVGFVGSLKPWHGVELLLEAFADVRTVITRQERCGGTSARRSDNLHLLIVGDGPQREALYQLRKELGLDDSVTFTGVVSHDDVPKHLAAIDIAVVPYLSSDGFYYSPLKMMEYMAMGVPVVAPMLGQIPSLLRGPGKPAGLLYRADDRHELGTALLQLILDRSLRQVLGNNGAERARREHSWQHVATTIIDHVQSRARAKPDLARFEPCESGHRA